MSKAKSYSISREEVDNAYRQVKANKGAAGVDKQSLVEFGINKEDNLYKIWNRMASGSYFPPPVRRVEIPKEGGTRPLGIPTVADRIAQTVVKNRLEPELEKHFHQDSYGYRPGKSAVQAVGVARERCWRYDWVLDLDIRAFFDSIDHQLLMKALRLHTESQWILLYVERWLTAPVQYSDGAQQERAKGTPQGGVISPLLANLFLHYVFDKWMQKHNPGVLFERYADDVVCHLRTEEQALQLKASLEKRFEKCGLELHPEKTKIVYCKDDDRPGSHPNEQFDFLGFTFRPRVIKCSWGKYFVGFNPALSGKAKRKINQRILAWRLYQNTDKRLEDLARACNPVLRGWVNYYGSYRKSELSVISRQLEAQLVKWVQRKYKKMRGHRGRAYKWLERIKAQQPSMFVHWQMFPSTTGL